MTVTFVLPNGMGLSGVVTWSLNMARKLNDSGTSATLLEHHNPDQNLRLPVIKNVRIIRYDGRLPELSGLMAIDDYRPVYEQVLPGTIIPNWSSAVYGTWASLTQSRPEDLRIIGYAHSDDPNYYNLLPYYEPIISLFVAVSAEVGAKLGELLPHRRNDIRVRAYPVTVDSNLERTYSLPGDPIRLLYAGRLDQNQKRVADLIDLARVLYDRGVNFQLQIAGDGPLRGALERQVASLEPVLSSRVELLGRLPFSKMPAAWQSADICVLVSAYEGTSISMLEAMAGGSVPVVSDVSGMGAVIDNGLNGYTVPVGDLGKMASVIKKLENERTLLTQIGNAAHQTILSNYSFDSYLRWFLDLVEEAWSQSPRQWPANRPLVTFETARLSQKIFRVMDVAGLNNSIWAWKTLSKLRELKQSVF